MGRYLPVECHHGTIIDYGDFGHDDRCEVPQCPECFPTCEQCEEEERHEKRLRMLNRLFGPR